MSQAKPLEENIQPDQATGSKKAAEVSGRNWWLELGALCFFGLLSFVLLWPLSGHLAVSSNNEGDGLAQMWIIGWGSHALTHDPANLFNGNIFYPYINTLAYSDDLLAQTLQALPIYLLTGNLVLSYGLLTLFSFILSGWGTYLLVKESGGGRAGGLFAGMVFAFGSYKIGHLSQLNLLSTQWIPFCFLFLRRMLVQHLPGGLARPYRQGWPAVLALAFFFTLNALSSLYYFFYLIPVLGLYLLVFLIGQRRWLPGAFWLKLVMAALLAGLMIVPTLLPYATVVADQGAERTTREVEEFSANYRFYLGATPNNLLWGNSLSRFAGPGGERALFPGALAYLLAAVSLLGPLGWWLLTRFRRQPRPKSQKAGLFPATERWAWSAIALFSLIMSLGWTLHLRGLDIPGLYRLFYYYFPGWVAARAAVRYGMFVLLAVAMLAGLAVGWLAGREWAGRWRSLQGTLRLTGRSFRRSQVLGMFAIGLLLAGAFWEYRSDITYTNPKVLPNPPQVYRWLADPARSGVVLELPGAPDPLNPPSIRNYYTTFNWQPYVTGISGYQPPVEPEIDRLINDFPSPQSLEVFQGLGVRWLVYFLNDENMPLPPEQWQKIEARLAKTPEVRLAQDFPQDHIKVYELQTNPWMRQAYASLPPAADVIVSDYRRLQPTLIELIETMLRRDGHALYGTDRAGYRYLSVPPTGRPVSAGLFVADEDPALYGFSPSEESWRGHGLVFYQRKEKLSAAYDLAHDPKLADYNTLTKPLDINIEQAGLKFAGKSAGSGKGLTGEGRLNLLLSSFEPQTIRLNGSELILPGGLSVWHSEKLTPGQTVRVESAPGKTLYLNRAELVDYDPASPPGLTSLTGATLLRASTVRRADVLSSNLTAWTPPLSDQSPGSYILTLDIYRKPWGTHPNGHFATYSVALSGQTLPHSINFDFNPTTRKTLAQVDGVGVGLGEEVFKAAGNGDWTAFVTLRRSNPANPKDFPLVGLTTLYDFSLDNNQLSGVGLLGDHQVILLPPLSSSTAPNASK